MLRRPFAEVDVLDWGCGKGQISKMMRDLGPHRIESCDVQNRADSSFGQPTPIIDAFKISVTPLSHDVLLPYRDGEFDVVLSFGVLEHVAHDKESLREISRILKTGGLFFCFFLPGKLSWTQFVSRLRGDNYHDRLYTRDSVHRLLGETGFNIQDFWYRQILPKNTINYPAYRAFEHLDLAITQYTPLRYFATNIEFVAVKS
ncbi:MAG TPA: class I SAM-dependent methyltransferase [Edaphobacter sp.]|nr:class I SAM-dependent methyltransferase [Edaphobacter sp.]